MNEVKLIRLLRHHICHHDARLPLCLNSPSRSSMHSASCTSERLIPNSLHMASSLIRWFGLSLSASISPVRY
jgi:hypothetical protein